MELTSGERIKLRRKVLKISQTELAQKVGYSKSALCKIEKNQGTVNMAKIADFAKALNTTVAYLVGYDEQADPTLQIIENFVALSQEDKIRVVRCVLQKTDNYDELIFPAVEDFLALDHDDRIRVVERMETLLEADKYKTASRKSEK